MRLPHVADAKGLDVAIVGIPFDGGTSYRTGSRYGPREVRNQSSLIRSYNYFQKVAPFDRLNVADVGDIDAPPVSIEKCYDAVESGIGAILAKGARPLAVGGLTSHEALRLVRGLAGLSLVGGDIVEVSPQYDGPGQITAVLAANLMFEFLCALACSAGA